MTIPADILELAALYVAENPGLDLYVAAAFVAADQEPPPSERVKRMGFDAREAKLVSAFYAKYDPHNRADEDKKWEVTA